MACLGPVSETRAVRQWAEGTRDHPRVVQAWFQGMNPQLEDAAPARLIREGDLDEVGPRVLAAARAFGAAG